LSDQICFVIPATVAEGNLAQYLIEHLDAYRLALDLTGDYYDHRSQVDRVEITRVELDTTRVTIHYTVEYSGFRPCHDQRYSEKVTRRTNGLRSGHEFQFSAFKTFERRSTSDEL
jgi:hypothetical protein